MRVTTNVRRVSRPVDLDKLTKPKFNQAVRAAEKEMGEIAIELTSGTISTEELRRLDHPFSRRRPNARIPKLPINKQTGALQDALRIVRQVKGNSVQLFLRVNHPHAIVLNKDGTSRMVPRGFIEAFAKRTRGILQNAVRRAFRKK